MSTSSPRRPGPPRSTPAPPASSPASVRPPSRPRPAPRRRWSCRGTSTPPAPCPWPTSACSSSMPAATAAQTMTDAQGNWSVSGLPAGFNVVVIFVPFFSGTRGPCQGNGGGSGPPVPGPGQLQPVFYGNVWANLADPTFLNDPYTWGVHRGAITLSAPTANVDACITNCGRHRGPQTELQPECRGRGGERFDHAGGSSAQCVSIVGLYGCNLPPTRHDRIRPAARRLGPPRHLVDRPATLAAQPLRTSAVVPSPYETSHRTTVSNRDPLGSLPRSRRRGTPR